MRIEAFQKRSKPPWARAFAFLTLAMLTTLGPLVFMPAIADARTNPVGELRDIRVNSGQRSAICKTFLDAEQINPWSDIKLRGHVKTMQEECMDKTTPVPKDTLTAICRQAVTEILPQPIDTEKGNVRIKTTLDNQAEGKNPVAGRTCSRICTDLAFGANCGSITYGEVVTVNTPAVVNTKPVEDLTRGFAFWALLAAFVGILVSASMWAMGSKGENPGTELAGKKGMVLCVTAAFFVGAVPAMISYFDTQARQPGLDTDRVTSHQIPTVQTDARIGTSTTTAAPPPAVHSDGDPIGRGIDNMADACAKAAAAGTPCFGGP